MKDLKKRLYIYLFGEYDPNDTKYIIAFVLTLLFIAFMIFWFIYTRDFRKECAIEREMACGHVSREVAEEITNNRWFYF